MENQCFPYTTPKKKNQKKKPHCAKRMRYVSYCSLVTKAQAAHFPPEAKCCITRTRGHDSLVRLFHF